MTQPSDTIYERGDIFQITGNDKPVYVGLIVMAMEIKGWGIQGEVLFAEFDKESKAAAQISIPMRLEYKDIEFVGKAPLVPSD
jgi:hypothetical protein